MDEFQLQQLASDYGVTPTRMQSVINALIQIGVVEEDLLAAIEEVMPEVKNGMTPTEAANQWAEHYQTATTLTEGMEALGQGMNLVQQDDAEDVRYAAEYRGTAMRVQFHVETANVFLNGPTNPELQQVDQNAREGFRNALRGAAKKNYQVGGNFSSLTRQMQPSSPSSATNKVLPSAS